MSYTSATCPGACALAHRSARTPVGLGDDTSTASADASSLLNTVNTLTSSVTGALTGGFTAVTSTVGAATGTESIFAMFATPLGLAAIAIGGAALWKRSKKKR